MEASNKKLLAHLKGNCELAFQQIYEKYWENLYRVSSTILKDGELAKDVIQEVFIKIWLRRNDL